MKHLTLPLILLIGSLVTAEVPEGPLYLNITFPPPSDTVDADYVRLSGNTLPSAVLKINNRQISLFPQGSFATRTALLEGKNRIIVTAQKGDERIQDTLSIYRPQKPKSLHPVPTQLEEVYIEPAEDVWLRNGDHLSVQCKGSPGGEARFSIERFGKNFPMIEMPMDQTNGIAGIYVGVVKLANAPDDRPLEIDFELTGLDKEKKRLAAPGKLHILADHLPLIGMTAAPTFIYGTAKGYVPISRIPDSVKMHIIGRENRRFKIDLLNRSGYIDARDMKILPFGTPLPRATISAPVIQQDKNWLHLIMAISDRLPFRTNVTFNPLVVELDIWGARQASHWITYPNAAVDLEQLTFEQCDDHIFRTRVQLNQERSWGYKVHYKDGAVHLSIRRRPQIHSTNPVGNLVFAIDPGHGGEETGATSPLGVLEKDINRIWADKLITLLSQNGATVFFTRQEDETVSLAERVRRAEEENAHFFISLHNNGTTASGNPLSAQGTSVYFTLQQNKDLNWAIYPHMLKIGLAPYGRIYNSYFVTNATGFLVALVEGGFLTHPTEELNLANDEFIQKMADAVYAGIVDFLKANAE
ncbi:N-acetylmuramoyl-L-alanine amidase [candidate division KSB1 bacterium]|nr:N-acetylmuramoyl-L-alanine amidase [candidate division KSB1 bacterium]